MSEILIHQPPGKALLFPSKPFSPKKLSLSYQHLCHLPLWDYWHWLPVSWSFPPDLLLLKCFSWPMPTVQTLQFTSPSMHPYCYVFNLASFKSQLNYSLSPEMPVLISLIHSFSRFLLIFCGEREGGCSPSVPGLCLLPVKASQTGQGFSSVLYWASHTVQH